MTKEQALLAIVELGGYPDFTDIYEQAGYRVITQRSVRKAIQTLKKESPQVIVAEFNFQSDFRDRTSNLESLLAVVERMQNCKLVVFFELEYKHQLDRMSQQYQPHACIPYPIDIKTLQQAIRN